MIKNIALLYEGNAKNLSDTLTITITPTGGIPPPPGGTVTVIVTDAITKNPIIGANITSGTNQAQTDTTGTATITSTGTISISASGYLPKNNITVTTDTLQVSLIPIWLIGVGAVGAAVIVVGIALK